jgi:Subtilase family
MPLIPRQARYIGVSISSALLLGIFCPPATASQHVSDGLKRIFALDNANLDIDGIDDRRVDVDVAVLDHGIDLDSLDLNIADGIDCAVATPQNGYTCESDSPDDGDVGNPETYGVWHGTSTATVVGAIDNHLGTVGVAPGARIWSIALGPPDVYERHRNGETQTVNLDATLGGIRWIIATRQDSDPTNDIEVMATGVGAGCPPVPRDRIICPGGFDGPQSRAIEDAITDAVDLGVVVVGSSGNWAEDMGTFRFYNDNGEKNYVITSSMVDTDGLPGGLGAPGPYCGGVLDDGDIGLPDDRRSPASGWAPPSTSPHPAPADPHRRLTPLVLLPCSPALRIQTPAPMSRRSGKP